MKQSILHPQSNERGLAAQQEAFFMEHGLGTILLRPAARIVPPYAWIGHLPFARALIHLQKPRVFVELGTHIGNSFCGFCQVVKHDDLDTRCYAVDTWLGDANAGYYGETVYQDLAGYVESEYGDFAHLLRMKFDQALEQFPDGSIELLHIDGLHTYDAVKHDFETWKVKLSPRAVVLFHDTQVIDRGFGVSKFWSELREQYDGFEFTHSHGLGVLLVGEEIEPAFTKLIELSNAGPEPVQAIFELASRVGLDGEALSYQRRFAAVERPDAAPTTLYCELFLNHGQGFSEDAKLIAQLSINEDCGQVVFDVGQHAKGLVSLRFDPGVDEIALRKLKVRCRDSDGQWQPLEPMSDNAILHETGFTLFPVDPWVEYAISAEGINAFEFVLDIAAVGIKLVNLLIARIRRLSALEHELEQRFTEVMKLRADLTERDRQLEKKSAEAMKLWGDLTERDRQLEEKHAEAKKLWEDLAKKDCLLQTYINK